MSSALRLQAALANCGPLAPEDEFVELLISAAPDVPVLNSVRRPDEVYMDAFEWLAVLGAGASLITYGQALWAAYQRFVKPAIDARRGEGDHPFLFVTIQGPGVSFVQFTLDEAYSSEQEFLDEFEREAAALRAASDGPDELELTWELEGSGRWTKRNQSRRGHS